MRGVVHHLVLTVQDPDRSFAFYDAVLSALGYEKKDAGRCDWYLKSPLGVHSIHLGKASEQGGQRPHDRYSPGLHHVAWGVDSRDAVDRMYEVVQDIGGKILDAPAEGLPQQGVTEAGATGGRAHTAPPA